MISEENHPILPYRCDASCIQLLSSNEDAECALQQLRPLKFISFDLEWTIQGEVDIVTVATEKATLVIHISAFNPPSSLFGSGELPWQLLDLLIAPPVDCRILYQKFGWREMNGLLDLGYMALTADPLGWGKDRTFEQHPSLQSLVRVLLHRKLSKEEQRSDWRKDLTSDQVQSCDAKAGVEIYKCLIEQFISLFGTIHSESSFSFNVCDGDAIFRNEGVGKSTPVKWRALNRRFDEVNGRRHMTLDDIAAKERRQNRERRARRKAQCTMSSVVGNSVLVL